MKEKFHGSKFHDDSIIKQRSNYNPKVNDKELNSIIDIIERIDPIKRSFKDNLSLAERNALEELRLGNEIIIKKADKGNTLVIMDKTFYKDKLIMDHLNTTTYCKVDEREERKVMCNLKKLVEKYKKCLTPKEIKYVTDSDLKSSHFYVLPKIDKNERVLEEISMCNNIYLEMSPPIDLQARPIVAGPIDLQARPIVAGPIARPIVAGPIDL